MISTLIMGSPARRRTNPITRCRDHPHSAMQGPTTDEAPTNGLTRTTHADERTLEVHQSRRFSTSVASSAGQQRTARDEVQGTRARATAWTDLDTPVRGLRKGKPVNLRWVLVHLIEEYARHLGHMDLLREALDGRTGY